ncbi:MAG TPA: leucyl aminopeptidase family protein [Nevskia sp.]|nr:leucyl aminopeptidase family protein [Nevskia sp.]
MYALVDLRRAPRATPLIAASAGQLRGVLAKLGAGATQWARQCEFRGEPGRFCLVPDARGKLRCVLVGVTRGDDIFALAALPSALPAGTYRLDPAGLALDPARAAFGWGLGAYRYERYRRSRRAPARLAIDAATLNSVGPALAATWQVRDLVNTPTEDMGPAQLSAEIATLAQAYGASHREWVGAELLKANFPTIHAVGRGSHHAPRLVELTWGNPAHPRLALAGKGVCFDSGGLNIKTGDGMRWMKKDMGGAAHAIALAGMIMAARLPVHLTLLVPAVENAVSGNAYRPGEVIRTRSGVTVEVDNTDAEGRLVLCDALAYAVESKPDLLIDLATLTGAARVALGPELPALFSNSDQLAQTVLAAGRAQQDPLWQLPLWQPYMGMLDSRLADLVNSGPSRHAGAITAALFLQRFVPATTPWLHMDAYAWNDSDRPGRPQGGEAQGLRAMFAAVEQRYPRV